MFAFFGDPCRTKVPGSSGFEGSLCVLGCVQCPFLELSAFCVAGARDLAVLEGHNFVLCGRRRTSDTLLKHWQAWVTIRGAASFVSGAAFG
jgi:hypothetical protein